MSGLRSDVSDKYVPELGLEEVDLPCGGDGPVVEAVVGVYFSLRHRSMVEDWGVVAIALVSFCEPVGFEDAHIGEAGSAVAYFRAHDV